MHEIAVFWLRAAAALYAIGLLQTIETVLRRRSQMHGYVLGAFCVAVVLHGVSLTETAWIQGQFPVNNFYESIAVCGFVLAILFLLVYWRYQFQGLSVFLFPLIFVMTLIGSLEFPVGSWSTDTARNTWLVIHVLLVLLGYAALVLTAVASVFYLMQEKQLKSKKPGAFFDRLPPLGTLDDLISQSMGFGFAFLTLGVIAGCIWAFIESGTKWIGDPKIALSFVTWACCLMMVFLRVSAGWRGRKAAIMAISVLLCSAATWVAHVGLRSLLIQ